MKPKEKAIELVEQMEDKLFDLRDGYNPDEVYYSAKQCALLSVNEQLKTCDFKQRRYLIEVKKEIENL